MIWDLLFGESRKREEEQQELGDHRCKGKVAKTIQISSELRDRYKKVIKDSEDLANDIQDSMAKFHKRFLSIEHGRKSFWVDIERQHDVYGHMHWNEGSENVDVIESPFEKSEKDKGDAYKKLRALVDRDDD